MYRLRVIVEEIKGFCDLPMRVGDYFEVDGGSLLVPPGQRVCIWALQSLIPFLTAKQRNIVDDNDWVPTTSKISCPDPNGVVIYKVIRVGWTMPLAAAEQYPAAQEMQRPTEPFRSESW